MMNPPDLPNEPRTHGPIFILISLHYNRHVCETVWTNGYHNEKHVREYFDVEMEWNYLQAFRFAVPVATAFDCCLQVGV